MSTAPPPYPGPQDAWAPVVRELFRADQPKHAMPGGSKACYEIRLTRQEVGAIAGSLLPGSTTRKRDEIMTAIIRDPDGHVTNGPHLEHHVDGKCCMCDHLSNAVWFTGNPDLLICHRCAIDKLPKLIADAISGFCRGAKTSNVFLQAEDKILLNFWRGAAHAMQWRVQHGGCNPVMTNADADEGEAVRP